MLDLILENLDYEVIYNPAYWIITVGVIIAFIMGFSAAESGMWGMVGVEQVYTIPFIIQVLLILLTPVIAYFVVLKVRG